MCYSLGLSTLLQLALFHSFLLLFSHQIVSSSLWPTPWTAAHQASLSFTIFWGFIKTQVHWVNNVIWPSHPLSPPSPPTLNLSQHQGLFQMSWLFASGGQSIGASASVSALPMNIQGASSILLQDTHVCFHICFGSCPSEASWRQDQSCCLVVV